MYDEEQALKDAIQLSLKIRDNGFLDDDDDEQLKSVLEMSQHSSLNPSHDPSQSPSSSSVPSIYPSSPQQDLQPLPSNVITLSDGEEIYLDDDVQPSSSSSSRKRGSPERDRKPTTIKTPRRRLTEQEKADKKLLEEQNAAYKKAIQQDLKNQKEKEKQERLRVTTEKKEKDRQERLRVISEKREKVLLEKDERRRCAIKAPKFSYSQHPLSSSIPTVTTAVGVTNCSDNISPVHGDVWWSIKFRIFSSDPTSTLQVPDIIVNKNELLSNIFQYVKYQTKHLGDVVFFIPPRIKILKTSYPLITRVHETDIEGDTILTTQLL